MSETAQANRTDEQVEEYFNQIISSGYRHSTDTIDSQSFTLFPNYVETKVGGIVKAISLIDFKTIIDGMLQTEQKLAHLALPFNCFMCAKSTTEVQLACYHPERTVDLEHINRETGRPKKFKVPFPNTIVSYILRLQEGLWVISQVKFFCTDKKVTQLPEDRLITAADHAKGIWAMPFPNFYPNGNMCYGRNTMPSKFTNNLRGLDFYYQVIFGSPFNDDLGLSSVQRRNSPAEWFKYLSTLSQFPYSDLKK